MANKIVCVETALILTSVLVHHINGKTVTNSTKVKPKGLLEDEFDGMPLPESLSSPGTSEAQSTQPVKNTAQLMYSVPIKQLQPVESYKIKKPGKDDDGFFGDIMGATLMSGGTLLSLGTFALIAMAGKAFMLAVGAIVMTLLSTGWLTHGGDHKASSSTVYEVIAKPYVSHGHSYSAEVHHEPYSPTSPTSAQDPQDPYNNNYSGGY
ncbi:uncharacterized protein LOC126843588 [Adelges cooleyi]|uniref:uncharacterized protein LOC126843588 n=1 Tax=Adelges cooleyi TaxID=133065 RepID=UPI00217F5FD3|nr:uncharacterized protein LOC126843588 [Adelges cooleyi]